MKRGRGPYPMKQGQRQQHEQNTKMTTLNHYMQDGACAQARATLAFLQGRNIEESWSDEWKSYQADVNVARWENCREQGYVVSLNISGKQINIAFFEHCNSDSLCAIEWEQSSINSLTIGNAQFGDVYKDKYDVSKTVSYGDVIKMAQWIWDRLSFYWHKHAPKKIKAEAA